MIEVDGLTKKYGDKTAVDGLSFTIEPGIVTGFLGPNGAGKSTTMRVIAGLDAPTRGIVRVNGESYQAATAPMAELGIMLEARAVHTGRSARNHLLALAQTNGVPAKRVSEVIDMVGLAEVAGKRVGGFSLGMGQRLGVAAALLGDPQTVVLDEPVNGLDPEGVLWIRHLLRALADEGRTVFISSHLMSEMALTAQHLIIVGQGRLIADTTVDGFIARASGSVTHVRSPQAHDLSAHLSAARVTVAHLDADTLEVTGLTAQEIGTIAWEQHIPIFELTTKQASLEEAFMELTRDAVDYRSADATDGILTPADTR
jgi:ABC-2 type transport system ATP-binding protein